MNFIYTFFICFILVFLSELGDKTQLIVLSFSTKNRARSILSGVAIGTFFSHGLAILFGSKLGSFQNETVSFYLELFTYASFILFGILGFLPKKEDSSESSDSKLSILQKLSNIKLGCTLVVALNIIVGEIGDKTFLASLGLGLQYPKYKVSLILGSIFGMVCSNSIALFFGRFLGNKFNPSFVELISNLLFIVFGIVGLFCLFL